MKTIQYSLKAIGGASTFYGIEKFFLSRIVVWLRMKITHLIIIFWVYNLAQFWQKLSFLWKIHFVIVLA